MVIMREEDRNLETNMYLQTGIEDSGDLAGQKTEIILGQGASHQEEEDSTHIHNLKTTIRKERKSMIIRNKTRSRK